MCYNALMKVKVYAKLNLTLKVGARQGAFHPIDSVATSVDVCDVVEVVKRTDSDVHVEGVSGVAQTDNTAYKAAHAFSKAFSSPGVDVFVKKGIPFGAGLGGSSADAAAVLYCMCKLFGVDVDGDEVRAICARLGSDVTFMLHGGLGRLCGKGDDVEFFALKRPIYFALTTFDTQMSTAEVYAAFDRIVQEKAYAQDRNNIQIGNIVQSFSLFSNDLQLATRAISDYADEYLAFAEVNGLSPVMTGSGSAYFIAFSTFVEAQNAANLLNYHGFCTVVCQTVPNGIKEI